MLCPMHGALLKKRSMGVQEQVEVHHAFGGCDGKGCAWWDAMNEQCGILTIGMAASHIAGILTERFGAPGSTEPPAPTLPHLPESELPPG